MAEGGISRWRDQVVRTVRALGPEDTQPLPRLERDPPPVPADLVEVLRTLGVALVNSANSAATVTRILQAVAAAFDVDVQALVLPTSVMFRIGDDRIDLVAAPNRSLRLDQIAGITEVADLLQRAAITPTEGLRRLRAELRSRPRFGPLVTTAGQIVLSLGFGLMLYPDAAALPAYVGLGAVVGLLVVLAQRWPTLAVALPVVAAFLATVLAVLIAPWAHQEALQLVTPALVTLLPGTALTLATIELASDQMVAGASRLVWGVAQLLLLTFGVLAGLSLGGGQPATPGADPLGPWAPWAGVAVATVGFLLFSSAPRGSLIWLTLTLFAAYGAQTVGALILNPQLSGFVGGLVIVPLTEALARFRAAPAAAVLLLPAFWLLVPGALGLRGISQLATGLGAQSVAVTAISVFAIALGVLVGSSLTRDAATVRRTWRGQDG